MWQKASGWLRVVGIVSLVIYLRHDDGARLPVQLGDLPRWLVPLAFSKQSWPCLKQRNIAQTILLRSIAWANSIFSRTACRKASSIWKKHSN